MRTRNRPGTLRVPVLAVVAVLALGACTSGGVLPDDPPDADTSESDAGDEAGSTEPPEVGACRVLEAADVAEPSDDTAPVACTEDHTAETFFVGELPPDAAYGDPGLAAAAYEQCQPRWVRFTGANESLALRTVLSWAWFGPSEQAWEAGARWVRCDLVGGLDRPDGLVALPESGKGVLLGIPPDRWMACVAEESVQDAAYLPCTEPHRWRAVSTIVVSQEKKYPGERLVEVLAKDYCSDSVIAWLDYPPQVDYAYTWFGEAEWEAGNNRAVCWARTDA